MFLINIYHPVDDFMWRVTKNLGPNNIIARLSLGCVRCQLYVPGAARRSSR